MCLIYSGMPGLFKLGAAEIRMNKTSEAHGEGDNETKVTDLPFDCNEIGRRLKKLFTNAPFLLISLFVVCDNIIISGFQAFGPKFVEQQFGLQASVAGSVFGKPRHTIGYYM